tara:strand:- start:2188 stop:9438 length:7251 start_codon:yes stop_codon:yes gene_type:complete
MPQKTNLNINPYYDDFKKSNNYYRVLYKPGHPIQARELTTSQSILQNQLESFGSHIFQEGAMVIPGGVMCDSQYAAVKLNPDHLGVNISVYASFLVGKRLRGESSGVVAVVDSYSDINENEGVTHLTIWVKYVRGGTDNETSTFIDGEILITEDAFTYGNTTINVEDTVASIISENAKGVGYSVAIEKGVYFIRGTFVDVSKDRIVLDPYTNNSSYRVGLTISEEIISSKEDESLYDNAKGFSNYAAPGADRLKISTKLSKKLLTDNDDKTFVELVRVENGEIKKIKSQNEYSIIKDYFAKRTFEESGDYAVDRFIVDVEELLDNRKGNDGIFLDTQITSDGNVPTEDMVAVNVSAGKAYVKGYDVESVGTTTVDVDKPRDIQKVDTAMVPFEFGLSIRLNNVVGTPLLAVNNSSNTVDLYSGRRSATGGTETLIGKARVYSFSVTDAPYTGAATEFDLYLYDVQTYTIITLNESISSTDAPISTRVRGVSSGATGFIVENPSSTAKLTETSGTFLQGERLIFNEEENSSNANGVNRTVKSVDTWGINDVKSVFQDSTALGLDNDFIADLALQPRILSGFSVTDEIEVAATTGITKCPGRNFAAKLKVGSLISYQRSDNNDLTLNKVTANNGSTITLDDTPLDVTGLYDNNSDLAYVGTFRVMVPIVRNNGGLYAKLDESAVSSVDFSSSSLAIETQINDLTTDGDGALTFGVGNVTTANAGITTSFFETFDAERYSIHYSTGTIDPLTSDKFTLTNNGKTVNFTGLTASQNNNVTVNATVLKQGITSKQKDYLRSEKRNVTLTKSAASTATTGLTQNKFYGLRVEDREISLNVPDVAKVIGVYESLNTSAPILDKISIPSGFTLSSNALLGEEIIGTESGTVVQITSILNDTSVEFAYLNTNKFEVGEVIKFRESDITTTIVTITNGSYQNVTNEFTLDRGHRETHHDYSRIVRTNTSYIPTYQLLVVYDKYRVPANDNGDVFTVNSYPQSRYSEIPQLPDGTRLSDVLDFRPRVSDFSVTNKSPFAFGSRDFGVTGNNPSLIVKPNESSIIGFDHYLPRMDRLVLTKAGKFTVVKGESSLNPKFPVNVEDAMDIATIQYPPYLFDVKNARVVHIDNRRYTMRDIGKIESRVENLETVTSLTMLELDTKSLQVKDADGFDRFKTGFFVDDYRDDKRFEQNSNAAVDPKTNELLVPIDFETIKPELALDPSIDVATADFSANLNLLDPNVKKSEDLLTLNYTEKEWIKQPLASVVENVNPFNMVEYNGNVKLSPASDNWVRTVYIDGGVRNITAGVSGNEVTWTGADGTQQSSGWTTSGTGTGSGDNWQPDENTVYVAGAGTRTLDTFIETILQGSAPDTHIRSRNVTFNSHGLAPYTKYYSFFDGQSGLDIIPKLVQISMNSGAFTAGETVHGYIGAELLFVARLCSPNHKEGPLTAPTTTIGNNPYDRGIILSLAYSASSTVLNIDLNGLHEEARGEFYGYITKGMTILGVSSNAEATVSNIQLITDNWGDLSGSFFIRCPLTNPAPPKRYTIGTKTFKLTSSDTNAEPLPGSLLMQSCETTYRTSGIVETYKHTTVVVKDPPAPPPPPPQPRDPLAQSFTVDETGAYLTGVDFFFGNKDPQEKIACELVTMELGTPTNIVVQDFARVELHPSEVNTSADATIPTRFQFPSPIYLEAGREYALVLKAPTTNLYEAWCATMGDKTVGTSDLPDDENVLVTKQYIGGSLFKSQNGTIWTPSQFQDLKFTLHKAQFVPSGTATFYNPNLNLSEVGHTGLIYNPIKVFPRKLKVTIDAVTGGSSTLDQPGAKISDGTTNTDAFGYLERVGGGANQGALTQTNAGTGYENGTYTAVPLYTITGAGSGATATVVVATNKVSSVTIGLNQNGSGYSVGDVVGVTTADVGKGSGAQFSIPSLLNYDTLYLTDCRGETFDTSGSTDFYVDGTVFNTGSTHITACTQTGGVLYTGNVVEIQKPNHAMHGANNLVTLENIQPNSVATTLSAELGINETGQISIANTSTFNNFEGISTSQGYAKINNEIIYYNSITSDGGGGGTLGIGTRGVDGTLRRTHPNGSEISTYELSGVSLKRINRSHTAGSILSDPMETDKYYLSIDRSGVVGSLARQSGDTQVSFTAENVGSGLNNFSSANVQFNTIEPRMSVITPGSGTFIRSSMRTISATSAGGNEVSFQDNGFEPVTLNQLNILPTTRMLASRVNENEYLPNFPDNKSFTMTVDLRSDDPNLSPAINIENEVLILGRSRLNKPISDYVTDGRSNALDSDPHTATYITKKVNLQNPASSLKVIVGAYRDESADFRVLYQLFKADSSEIEPAFELFPGYDNLRDLDGDGFGDLVIDSALSSGRPDKLVSGSLDGEFKEYQFSIDELDAFTGFRVKIVMSGTNEAKPPRFKDLRCIALA